jgi:hypothetical protein
MRRIIGGKAYDTETAQGLAEAQKGLGRSEELYRTKKGSYFVAHWTQWDGEHGTIELVDDEQARQFLEYLNSDGASKALEEYFIAEEA